MTPLQNKSLFWDTDVRKLNPVAHKQYIIERILRFGDWEDYKWLRASYPEEEIKQVLLLYGLQLTWVQLRILLCIFIRLTIQKVNQYRKLITLPNS